MERDIYCMSQLSAYSHETYNTDFNDLQYAIIFWIAKYNQILFDFQDSYSIHVFWHHGKTGSSCPKWQTSSEIRQQHVACHQSDFLLTWHNFNTEIILHKCTQTVKDSPQSEHWMVWGFS